MARKNKGRSWKGGRGRGGGGCSRKRKGRKISDFLVAATRPCLLPSRVSWIVLTTPSNLPCATTLRSIIPRLRCNEISTVHAHTESLFHWKTTSPFSYINTRPPWTCLVKQLYPCREACGAFILNYTMCRRGHCEVAAGD